MSKVIPKESSVSYAKGCDLLVSFSGKVEKENRDGSYDIRTDEGVVTNVHKSYLKLAEKKAPLKTPSILEKGPAKIVAHVEEPEPEEVVVFADNSKVKAEHSWTEHSFYENILFNILFDHCFISHDMQLIMLMSKPPIKHNSITSKKSNESSAAVCF